jgi:predicted amidohydrolase
MSAGFERSLPEDRRMLVRHVLFALPTVILSAFLVGAADRRAATGTVQKTVRGAGIVLKWVRADKEANFQRIEPMIREAARKGAQLVVTTECFLDGYAFDDPAIPLAEYRALGEPIPDGPYFKRLAALARELKIYLVAGMLEADGKARYNAAVFIGPDGALIGKYHKQNLDEEILRNTPGHVSSVHKTPFGKVGILICADRRESGIVRRFRENGADFLICPSGGMFGSKKNDPMVQARSKENRLPIVFVHPAEFLVTEPDGSIRTRTLVGNQLVIPKSQVGGKRDTSQIFYFDLIAGKQ